MMESAAGPGRLHLTLSGCLDIATAPRLDARLLDLERERLRVQLDLEQLTFIDLQGLRVIHTRLLCQDRAAPSLAVGPRLGPCVRRLLDLTGIELWPAPVVPPRPLGPISARRRARTRVPPPARIRLPR